ncbi:MAG: FAD-binding oxidoreductase [Pseudomonadota bacterium]
MTAVANQPHDYGVTGWNAVLDPPAPPEVLTQDITSDCLIIGAGFAGLSAARRLAQIDSGARIAVVDATRLADGPAGRNSGFMIDVPHDLMTDDYGGLADADRQLITLNRAAIEFAGSAAQEYGLDASAFNRCGKVNAAATDKGLRHNTDYARHLDQLGEPCEKLDAAEMRELTGTDYYRGGLYTPGTAMIQPAVYVRSVAQGLIARNRVSVYENSPVIELARHDGTWRAVTSTGSVTAPKVILAVNGHVESFGFFTRRLVHITLYASLTRALTNDEIRRLGGHDDWGLTPADPMGSSVRKISGPGGHRILVRNRASYSAKPSGAPDRLASVGRTHRQSFERRFPMLGNVPFEYTWSGRLCLSRNNVWALGEIESGLFSACCQNGLGTTRGTAAGIIAAELAAGVDSPLMAELGEQPLPQRLPPEPFATIGASAVIRWGEMKAGAEL